MPGPWDDLMKRLIRAKPEHFIKWLLARAQFKEQLSAEANVLLFMDGLLLVEEEGQAMLVAIEIQSKADPRMRERLQEYSLFASRQNGYLPVCSYVVYLRKGINIAPSPLIRRLPNGKVYDHFEFEEIELADVPAEQLLQSGLTGILPLSLLAKGAPSQKWLIRSLRRWRMRVNEIC